MITFMQALLQELEHESIGTRKMLALVPNNKADFKPHPKSMSLKDLSTHLADIPRWVHIIINTTELDFAKIPNNPKEYNGGAELTKYFDENLATAKKALASSKDDILQDMWTMRSGDTIFSTLSKYDNLRHTYGQIIHHRAQLGVYLRLLNIPIPGVYGPSADEQVMQTA